jgi:3-methyladenine DNA glycosylase AlkD
MKIDNYINKLRSAFEKKANPERAAQKTAYMRNLFPHFGLVAPEQHELLKSFLKEHGLPDKNDLPELIDLLWAQPEREFQHFGQELIAKYSKKVDKDFISIYEFMIVNKSWWDSIDMIASHLVGTHLKRFPELIPDYTEKWMASGNFWLQRTALLFQLKYKKDTDVDLMFDLIKRLAHEKEFFIRKAIGWVLREYSKTDPERVIQFVEHNQLSHLSKTEALKVINRKKIRTEQ